VFAAALKYLGYSVNDRDPKHWEEAKQVILKAKPYWAAFNASSYIKELASGNIWLVHGYSNDIFQADQGAEEAKQKFRVRHSLPKEGAVLALDVMVVAKGAPRPDLAHQFINFMLEGRNSADLTNMIGSGGRTRTRSSTSSPRSSPTRPCSLMSARSRRSSNSGDESGSRRLLNRMWTEIKSR
jgi:spermidine/putrescine transport system substrate-binding protein